MTYCALAAVLAGLAGAVTALAGEPPPIPPVPLSAVRVEGNAHFSDRAILDLLGWQKLHTIDPARLRRELRDILLPAYQEAGYLSALVDTVMMTVHSNGPAAVIFLQEGVRTILRSVVLSGVPAVREPELLRGLALRDGRPFRPQAVEQGIETLLQWHDNHGYPFARVHIDEKTYDSMVASGGRWVDLILHVTAGPSTMIDSVLVVGNDFTRAAVVIRESGLIAGTVFSQQRLSDVSKKLDRVPYLDAGRLPELVTLPDGRHGIRLTITERPAHQFNGILGYVPPDGNRTNGYMTGLIDLEFGNLLGTGRSLSVLWRGRDATSQDLALHYSEPWLLGSSIRATIGFSQSIQDSSFLKRSLDLELGWPIGPWLQTNFRIGRESTAPDDFGRVQFGIPASNTLYARFGLTYDTRDDRTNPRSGLLYSTGYTYGRRNNADGDDTQPAAPVTAATTDRSIDLEMHVLLPFSGHSVGSARLAGTRVTTSNGTLPYSHLVPLGGTRSLRGYREDQFRGSTIGWFNLEYRYLLGRQSRLFLFYDGGVIDRARETLWKTGYGWGFRMDSRLGVIGVDYGLGEGDSPANGKLHFGLENAF